MPDKLDYFPRARPRIGVARPSYNSADGGGEANGAYYDHPGWGDGEADGSRPLEDLDPIDPSTICDGSGVGDGNGDGDGGGDG